MALARAGGELVCRAVVMGEREEKSAAMEEAGEKVRWRLWCLGVPSGDLSVATGGVDEPADDPSNSTALMLD